METRTITEYKVYVLELAHMTGGVDKAEPVAIFGDLQKLKDFYNSQVAEIPYVDEDRWHKVFKKGSILEWFNPTDTLEVRSRHENAFGGVFETWTGNLSFRVPFNPLT